MPRPRPPARLSAPPLLSLLGRGCFVGAVHCFPRTKRRPTRKEVEKEGRHSAQVLRSRCAATDWRSWHVARSSWKTLAEQRQIRGMIHSLRSRPCPPRIHASIERNSYRLTAAHAGSLSSFAVVRHGGGGNVHGRERTNRRARRSGARWHFLLPIRLWWRRRRQQHA